MSTSPTCSQGRTPSMYLTEFLNVSVSTTSDSAFRSSLIAAIASISCDPMPFSVVAIMAPLLSLSDTTVAPSSMALRAAYWATFPDPEMATLFPANDSLPSVAYLIMCETYWKSQHPDALNHLYHSHRSDHIPWLLVGSSYHQSLLLFRSGCPPTA